MSALLCFQRNLARLSYLTPDAKKPWRHAPMQSATIDKTAQPHPDWKRETLDHQREINKTGILWGSQIQSPRASCFQRWRLLCGQVEGSVSWFATLLAKIAASAWLGTPWPVHLWEAQAAGTQPDMATPQLACRSLLINVFGSKNLLPSGMPRDLWSTESPPSAIRK